MTTIPFGEWTPDLGPLGNPGLMQARNCLPQANGYRSLSGLSVYVGPASLGDRVVGAASAKDRDGNTLNYAAIRGTGNAARLYQLSASSWVDRSGNGVDGTLGYGLNEGEGWEFVKWGESMLAAAVTEPLQQHMFGATSFADAIASGRRPRGRHIAVIKDFVVLGNVDDSVGAGATGLAPSRVWWSGINDVSTFEEGGISSQSDYQDLQSGGAVQRIIGGETGTVFCETSIYRMTYVGSPVVFQFDEAERNRGVWIPGSVATAGRLTFFVDRDGWYVWDGQTSTPIGVNRIDRAFLEGEDAIALAHLDRVSAVADPVNHLYYCAYASVNASDGVPDRVLVFDWINRRWSLAEIEVDCLFRGLSEGFTVESLDALGGSVDALEASLDSAVYTGRNVSLAAFSRDHALCYFTGAPLPALIETGDLRLDAQVDGRTLVTAVRPLVQAAEAVTVQPLSRDRPMDPATEGDVAAVDARGACILRVNARFHRFRVRLTGPFFGAQGLDVGQSASTGRR